MPSKRVACLLVLLSFWSDPAPAQVDFTGMWRPMPRNEDGSGMDGDYAGLPLNAAGRSRARSTGPQSRLTIWKCLCGLCICQGQSADTFLWQQAASAATSLLPGIRLVTDLATGAAISDHQS
jgi:hypothetical protein